MRARMHRELDQVEPAFDDMMQAVALSGPVLKQTMTALRTAGYWRARNDPDAITPDLEDAIQACMLNKRCN
jgi:hypothetical protein